MHIELTHKELLLAELCQKAQNRLVEYITNHPAADENDHHYAGRLNTVQFFQAQLAEAVINRVVEAKMDEPQPEGEQHGS